MAKKKPATKARKLAFPDDKETADSHFDILWTAFCMGFPRHAKGYEQLKLCNRIGAKLEGISEEMPDQDTAPMPRRERTGDVLLLEQQEWGKLKAMIKGDDVPWTYRAGVRVENAVEWLEESQTIDVELTEM